MQYLKSMLTGKQFLDQLSTSLKLNAIANRRRKKDFWDYAELLEHFDQEKLLFFYL